MSYFTALLALLLTLTAQAGDILRGGAGANQLPAGATVGGNTAVQGQVRFNAQDAMARTAQAIESVRAMQLSARQAAQRGPKNLGADPNHPGQTLPDVPDGVQPGGLQVAPGATPGTALWSGAGAPVPSFAGSGRVNVKIKQTQQQALLNWQTFNVGGNTTLTFDQSSGGSNAGKWIAFNKVNDPTGRPSQIIGSIQAQGQVYGINGNGIIFGGSSQVNTHTLVASALPINDNLITRGLLNNPDAQFLFSGIALPAGTNGTDAFTPPASNLAGGRWGDVTVQAGAQLTSPTSASHVGGRIALIGANVTNAGTLSTPDGQTILAAGLQVGVAAHNSNEPSLHGLDVFVGAVADVPNGAYAGTVKNSGIIETLRGNTYLTGKTIQHTGIINSSTSVSLNGRVDIDASYDAVPNTAYKPAERPGDVPFLFKKTGSVELGAGSVLQVLPEWSDTTTVAGTALALKSIVNIRGLTTHLGSNAIIFAPSGTVNVSAGEWDLVQTASSGLNRFVRSAGQIYLDRGAMINVAGTTDAAAQLADFLLTVQLRGAEVAGSPLQRNSIFRLPDGTGATITVDLRRTGNYNGFQWVGTPLADLSGYLNLIQRTVSQLTTAGGTVNLNAGGSVVMQAGSKIDVSAGWVNYSGGTVKTSRVVIGGHIFDIADAPPDRLYSSVFTGQSQEVHSRWGVTKTYNVPFLTGSHVEQPYLSGAAGGAVNIAAPGVALDGTLLGHTVAGPRQQRSGNQGSTSDLPQHSAFSLAINAEQFLTGIYPLISPTPADIIFQSGVQQVAADAFSVNASGIPATLRADRLAKVYLSPDLYTENGFGSLTVKSPGGRITVPAGITLQAPAEGGLTLSARNIDVLGNIIIPGGTVNATVFNIAPAVADAYLRDPLATVVPSLNPGRGIFTLGSGATISTAGLILDDRLSSSDAFSQPAVTQGGSVSINAFSANLSAGSLIDVSGGVRMDPWGTAHYGNAGSISIKTGQDVSLKEVTGGKLTLQGTLLGRSGAEGGSLSMQAQLIQIGGAALNPNTLLLQPDFFNQGGFTNFTLTGLGFATGTSGKFVPGLYIAPGTVIAPVADSYVAVPHQGEDGDLGTKVVQKPEGLRSPVNLHFNASGVDGKDGLIVRGDLVFGAGAVIRVDPLGEVALHGQTAAVLGSIYAPGGSIDISGGKNSFPLLFSDLTHALTTVYIGSQSVLSTAGTTVLLPDAYGRRIGEVLPGGQISVTGNIVAAAGAVLDVSGTHGDLDFHPTVLDPAESYVVPLTSGLTTPLYRLMVDRTRVDSSGGFIQLTGGQMLFVDATLRGFAGGPTAEGGALSVTSSRYYEPNVIPPVLDSNLVVTQSGPVITNPLPDNATAIGRTMTGAGGTPVIGRGYFAADTFMRGGFDSLALNGVVEFSGPVTINARGILRVADGGVLHANADVHLTAAYIALGKDFVPPVLPENRLGQIPFTNVAPTYGTGRLFVTANNIDIGTLSLQGVGNATLTANGGDIRGNGILDIAGHLTLRAAQIYPTTLNEFSIFAYDYTSGGSTHQGSIRIEQSGSQNLPLSAGGTLSLYASKIEQFGTLRAPFGIINLGWDGTGTAPKDLVVGTALTAPITQTLTLGAGSTTSVSAVDPLTGQGIIVPYGYSDGTSWFDPRGFDISGGGLPEKAINLSGASITTQRGSTIDLRGGGDLYAFQWKIGNGGPTDILGQSSGNWTVTASYKAGDLVTYHGVTYSARVNSQGITPAVSLYWSEVSQSFAVVPGYDAAFAPYTPFASYFDHSLGVGDRIVLGDSKSLAGGTYTLLPARYALLPGAVLVTPKTAMPIGTYDLVTGASLVSGYRFNGFHGDNDPVGLSSRFEIAPAAVVNARATYDSFFATSFLAASAERLNIATPLLPNDSGYLLFQASQAMSLQGQVLSQSIASGHGSAIDIAASLNFEISNTTSPAVPGTISLDSGVLAAFGAESLVIGGKRTRTSTGTNVTVLATDISVSNAGSPLTAPDVTLVSKGSISVGFGSEISSTGTLTNAETYSIVGNGTLLRVSQDVNAEVIRTGVTPGGTPSLNIAPGGILTGGALILDSIAAMVVDSTAILSSKAYSFSAGRVSLQFNDPGSLQPTPGFVLTGSFLEALQNVRSLSLLSYSTIDFYGTGSLSGLQNLAFNAGEFHGFNQSGGSIDVTANTLTLGNKANVTGPGVVSLASGTLSFRASTIQLGANQLAIDQFNSVSLTATQRIIGNGQGGLSTQNALTIATPLLTGAAGSIRTITAGGNLTVDSSGGAASGNGGLGATLSLTGKHVSIGTSIALPSGSLAIRSTTGDLTITGSLNVSGTAQTFYDVTRYTNAGQISLTSDLAKVVLDANSIVNVAGNAAGGNAGTLSVSAGTAFTIDPNNTLLGQGGAGGTNGNFQLDVAALPTLATLGTALGNASLTQSQSIRVRTGNVIIDGVSTVRSFSLSADQGGITVDGTIDASGTTGGTINLASRGDLILSNGSLLNVHGDTFDNAGKGGSVTLESGTQRNGVVGTGVVNIQTGSTIDLSVASKVAGDAATVGSSAFQGKYSGKLHIRAPQNAGGTDLLVSAINGTIIDASSIVVEGYKLYDLTAGGGTISSAVQTSIFNDAQSFLGADGTTTATYTTMLNRLLANNAGLTSNFVLAPGAEIINRTGDLTLGATNADTTADWNLSTFRFGKKGAAGVLTLRASGNVNFYNALSDGFNPTLASTDATWLWLARLSTQKTPNPLDVAGTNLPVNAQSWSYRITAGADLGAADFHQLKALSGTGSVVIGKDGGAMTASGGSSATTSSVISAATTGGGTGLFQVVRTGSGDIDISSAGSVQLLNQFATIYTAGTRLADPTLGGTFDIFGLSQVGGEGLLGANQQNYPALFSVAGGNVSINAGANIERLGSSSSRELPNNWLYRRGYVDPATGKFSTTGFGTAVASTTWWIDFSNFFEGIGALGGGNVSLTAGVNVTNVDAVVPTNARMSKGTLANPLAANQTLVELGGGDLTVRAGNNIDAGVYYVERGRGTLNAGGQITTNKTRSPGQINTTAGANAVLESTTWLPTTLFVGKSSFDVSARGNVLLGPVANAFLLPVAMGNSFWNKSYFSTYSASSSVNVSSLGGTLTLREGTYINNVFTPLLEAWSQTQQLLTASSSAQSQPWLRLAENRVTPFRTGVSLLPGTLRATAFSGDINLVGDLTLSPAASGTLELLTHGGINGLQPTGFNTNENKTAWVASRINVSDADPDAIYGVTSPFAYQSVPGVGTSVGQAIQTRADFLSTIDQMFLETGATIGTKASQQVKQTLHTAGLLHLNDISPVRLYAGTTDISGFTLFSPKPARVLAGRDVADVSLYLQNLNTDSISVVTSGRDIIPYNPNSTLRIAAKTGNNLVVEGGFLAGSGAMAGDIQINGPGILEVLAGRDLDLGSGTNNADGTAAGITSIGNARNPYLPFDGASIVAGAGIGPSSDLSNTSLDFDTFINTILTGTNGTRYFTEAGGVVSTLAEFKLLSPDEQKRFALDLFFIALRDAGRDHNLSGSPGFGNYTAGTAAIQALFGSGTWDGDIITRERDIRTKSGGNISLFAPGGSLTLAQQISRDSLIPPGIITESGGTINIFTNSDVNLGVSRIFTLRGGDIMIWSTIGNIAAGASSKTVQSAPPTRVLIDPTSADVTTDLAGLATGGGIGVLATVSGIAPGSVDLIAPLGTIDAGDAGIRATGNLNLAAVSVLNASNISVGGTGIGAPAAPAISAPNIGGLTSASNTAGASNSSAAAQMAQARNDKTEAPKKIPSIISVEILGYGGGEEEDEEEKRKKKVVR